MGIPWDRRAGIIPFPGGYSLFLLVLALAIHAALFLDYQSHAVRMEAEGISKERRRISREIHDIVGYTMANQLMIIQAVLSMENRNAPRLEGILRVP